MEQETKEMIHKVLSYIKRKVNCFSGSKDNIRIFFRYFNMTSTNENLKYLVKIMDKMNFKGEELIIEPNFTNFYSKFFNLALNLFEDKDKIKQVKMTITLDDLKHLNEDKKKIIFLYLQFSMLVENSIQIFFSFLNPKICESILTGKFTYLDFDSLNNPEKLLKSFKFEKKYGELENIQKKPDIELLGFEPLIKYFELDENNENDLNYFDDKKYEEIQSQNININMDINNNILPMEIPKINNNLDNKDGENTDKFNYDLSDKKENTDNNAIKNEICLKHFTNEIENENNKENISEELKEEIIEDKKLSNIIENFINQNEKIISQSFPVTPKKYLRYEKNSENNYENPNSNEKIINKIEIEPQKELKSKTSEKKNEPMS